MRLLQTKTCSMCNKNKELSEFYSQSKKRANGEEYTYYQPYCKECNKIRTKNWRKNNPDKLKEQWDKRDQKDYVKERKKIFNLRRRMNGKFKEWQQNNPEKLMEYRLYREQHKKHNITDAEWNNCKDYFNNRCAYCGIDEIMSEYLYSQDFHKDHVDHGGANDLSNCVPACKSCNSRKHNYKLEDWYNQDNEIFDQSYLDRIYKWLNEDYKSYIRKELLNQ